MNHASGAARFRTLRGPRWALGLGLLGLAFASFGQPAPRAYDIPAQDLPAALDQFARAAEVQVSADAGVVAGQRSSGVSGTLPAPQALSRLLQGTGLSGRWPSHDTVVIEAPAAGGEALQLAPVRIEGGGATADDTRFTTASSIERMDREQLDRFPVTSTGDLFREMPGVMAANNRNGAALDLNIRGLQGFGRVKVLVDGTESASSTYKGYGGEHSRAFVDPELLGSITVEKGPNAGPYGAGVVGGVVQMSTLSAEDLITEPGRRFGFRIRGTTQNNDAEPSGHEVIGPPESGSSDPDDAIVRNVSLPGHPWTGSIAGAWRVTESLELVAGLSHRQRGNYVAGDRGPVPALAVLLYGPGDEVFNTSEDADSVLLKAALSLPRSQRLEFGYSRLDSTFGEARSAAFGPTTSDPGAELLGYITQLNLSRADKQLYTAKYRWSPATPWLDLRLNLWASEADEFQAHDIRGVAFGGETHRAQDLLTRGRGMELWNTSELDLLRQAVSLRYGVTTLREKTRVFPLDGGIYLDPEGRRELHSLFLQAEYLPFDSLTLDAGIRHERYQVRGAGEVPSGISGQVQPLNIRHGETRNNPSVGATWRFIADWELFARYSEGWRPPSVKETINGLTADSNIGRVLLRPEFTRGSEAGVRMQRGGLWRDEDRLQASLAWFRNDTDDYVQGFAGAFRNADSAAFEGVELSLAYDLGPAFVRYALTRYHEMRFCGVVLAFDGVPACFGADQATGWDVSMSGLYVPTEVQHSATLGARLLDRRLTLGLRLTAAENSRQEEDSPSGWRDHEVYDLFATYQAGYGLTGTLNVENLRDRFYMDAGTSGMLAIPAPGRTAKFSLTYHY